MKTINIGGKIYEIKEVDLGTLSKDQFDLAIKSTNLYEVGKDEIIIKTEEYKELLCDKKNLKNLRGIGVDNWEGYENRDFISSDEIELNIVKRRIT